jgi:hypothetical protein
MTFNRLKEKLKETAEQAKELSQEATSKAMDLSQGVSQKAHELGGQLMVETRAKMQQALDNTLRDIERLRPILHEAGFIIRDIMFTITVPPNVKVVIRKIAECADVLNAMLADPESGLSDTQRAMLSLLAKANSMTEVTAKYGYVFGEFDLTMSLPPQLTIHLITKSALDTTHTVPNA